LLGFHHHGKGYPQAAQVRDFVTLASFGHATRRALVIIGGRTDRALRGLDQARTSWIAALRPHTGTSRAACPLAALPCLPPTSSAMRSGQAAVHASGVSDPRSMHRVDPVECRFQLAGFRERPDPPSSIAAVSRIACLSDQQPLAQHDASTNMARR